MANGPSDSRRWKKVSSSFIDEVKHEDGRVKVNIDGKAYSYADKSGKKYDALVKGKSKGRAFNKKVKTKNFKKGKR